MYQYPWRTNIWSQFHSPQPEIRDYLQTVARENDWYKFINSRHEIFGGEWRDEEAKWTLKIRDLAGGKEFEQKFDLFVELNGAVSSPQVTLPGLENYQGLVVHPGNWPKDLDLTNKRVALFGYGCTGVQLAPNVLPSVSELYTWFRSKAYMVPSPNPDFLYDASGTNFYYNDEQKRLLSDPDVYLTYRKMLDDGSNRRWDTNVNGSENGQKAKAGIKAYMKEKLKAKPEVYDMIVPDDYDFPCRRPTLCAGKYSTSWQCLDSY